MLKPLNNLLPPSNTKLLYINTLTSIGFTIFIKGKNQNKLSQENIDRIVETYKKREDVEKFAHVASFEEIKENDFNLNIPRYVDTFEEQEEVDIVELGKELVALNQQIKAAENDFLAMLDELAITDETREIIEATKAVFR